MRFVLALAAVMALAGCASMVSVASSSDRTVIIEIRDHDYAKAQTLASAECVKAGRKARLSGRVDVIHLAYDCVP